MNWLRDNILKILIILGVTIVVIVIIALLAKPKGDNVVSGSKYSEIETKLQNAAIKYVDKHKSLLPTSTDKVTKIKLKTLQGNNYIGKLVAVDDSKTKCDGYVEITKISEDKKEYRYTPFISCGKYYSTRTIGNYIIDAETKEGTFERKIDAGLYKIGDEYVFRGENVDNYILLNSKLYRIIKIDKDNQLQLISTNRTSDGYTWDDRYNVDRKKEDGINDFIKSRIHDTLISLYNNTKEDSEEVIFTDNERNYIVEHDFCIGKRASTDGDVNSGVECKETIPLKVGLITLADYARASIDSNCTSVFDRSCGNYNYFNSLAKGSSFTYATLTGVADNTYQFYKIRYSEVFLAKASAETSLYPVIYINAKTIYSNGSGTQADPYVVR